MRGLLIGNTRQRRWVVRALVLITFGAALIVVHPWRSAPQPSASPEPPRLIPASMTVTSGIHLLGLLAPAAAYVIETADGLVLIDSGSDPDARLLSRSLADLQLDRNRLRAILLTHVHADHSGGAESLRATTGARIYVGQGDAHFLREGASRVALFSSLGVADATLHPTHIDVELKGGEEFTIGEARFRALAAPGHTPGSICYLMERQELRVLFSGDVIMSLAGVPKSPARLDRPLGTYAAYQPPSFRGDPQSFLKTLRTLRALPVPDLVLPGHPRMDWLPQSPSLSQQRWEALLDEGIHDMETLLTRHQRDGALFLDGTPRRLLPNLYYLGDFGGFAVYGFFTGGRFFLVDAPGGPGLLDFCQERLRKLGAKPVTPAAVLLTSCDPEATAGLEDLVKNSSTQVVAAASGLPLLKKRCPEKTSLLAAEELPLKGWFEGKALPLDGCGLSSVAYEIRWSGKTVLFSGRIPIQEGAKGAQSLIGDLQEGRVDRNAYLASLRRLDSLKPDLWLPLAPVHGQNANLYDRDWEAYIVSNLTPLSQ